MYSPYHEMDICQFGDRMNELYRAGLSQRELAEQSGVPVWTIQQFEQCQRSINKAQADYLMMLANELKCKEEDLIEPVE